MSTAIAVAGKGGVGKTLVAGLLARVLAQRGGAPVLAVDADANSNLHEVLGLPAPVSVGAIREELKTRAAQLPQGMTKAEFLQYKLERSLAEGDGLDLLAMGRPEGPGCYCYANNLLRELLAEITDRYRFVIIDNEAGMEHLSRRLMQRLDLLLVVSDPTLRGIETAFRLSQVPEEVKTRVGRKALAVNRVPAGGLSRAAREKIDAGPLPLVACLEEDPAVARCDQELGSFASLYPNSPLARQLTALAARLDPIPPAATASGA